MKTNKNCLSINAAIILPLLVCSDIITSGQNTMPADTERLSNSIDKSFHKTGSFKMTTLTFGGNGASFTKVKGQSAVLTGGRGSATFNNRFTIGGGGWGMTKGVSVENNSADTYGFVKMGYGGIDVGYLFLAGEKLNLGTKLLIAGGALFKETVPETDDKGFRMFPVLEPTLYYQVSLSKLFRFEMGASYRNIWGVKEPYITARELSGFSCYVGFLVSACKCD